MPLNASRLAYSTVATQKTIEVGYCSRHSFLEIHVGCRSKVTGEILGLEDNKEYSAGEARRRVRYISPSPEGRCCSWGSKIIRDDEVVWSQGRDEDLVDVLAEGLAIDEQRHLDLIMPIDDVFTRAHGPCNDDELTRHLWMSIGVHGVLRRVPFR